MMINYGYSFQINIFFKKEGLFNRRRVSSSIFLSNDMFYSNKMGIGMNYKFFSTEADSGRGKEGLVNVRDKDFVSLREGNSNFFNTKSLIMKDKNDVKVLINDSLIKYYRNNNDILDIVLENEDLLYNELEKICLLLVIISDGIGKKSKL